MPYIPHTPDDVQIMLDTIGVKRIEDLFDEIPAHLKAGKLENLPDGLTEMEVTRLMAERARQDEGAKCFIGAGAYEHHIPAAVWEIATRGEFYTAYTPYQAEASQGTLQVIYEYQTMIARLTGMDVSNASVYDGASGLSEAVLMALRANRKSKSNRVLMPKAVNPRYRAACDAIVHNQDVETVEVAFDANRGTTPLSALKQYEGEDFAALVIAQPNFFGCLEDVDAAMEEGGDIPDHIVQSLPHMLGLNPEDAAAIEFVEDDQEDDREGDNTASRDDLDDYLDDEGFADDDDMLFDSVDDQEARDAFGGRI